MILKQKLNELVKVAFVVSSFKSEKDIRILNEKIVEMKKIANELLKSTENPNKKALYLAILNEMDGFDLDRIPIMKNLAAQA